MRMYTARVEEFSYSFLQWFSGEVFKKMVVFQIVMGWAIWFCRIFF